MNNERKTNPESTDRLTLVQAPDKSSEASASGIGPKHAYPPPSDPNWFSLVANTPLFILILDRNHRCRFLNHTDAFKTTAEILGRTPYEFYPPEYRPIARARVTRVFETGQADHYEVPVSSVDGRERWYECHLGPIIENGEVTAVSLIAVNVTARNQAEMALRESEERYRTLAEALPHPVWRCEANGALIECNRRWYEYTGQTPHEARGNGWMKALHPDDVARIAQKVQDDVAGGTSYEAEYRLRRASDGSYRWHLARAIPLRNERGEILYWFGGAIDIDAQKQAEAALRERKERLKQLVDSRTAQLREEYEAIQHLLRASDRERRLIADEIHDRVSQPLAAALLFFDSYERLKEQNPERARAACESGMQALRRISADARALTSGVRSPVFDKYGLEAAIRHLIHDRQQQPGAPQIVFHTEVAVEKLDSVLENAIYRVVQEGLTNAIRHSGSNTVRVDLVQQGDAIRVGIEDWGIGFDPQETKADCVGLVGIRLRARLLGGIAAIDSSPGRGTRIEVTLPVVPPGPWSDADQD